MVESDYVFIDGVPIDVGEHGEHDYLFHSGEPVTDRGESSFVFESGTGVGGQNLVGWWKMDDGSGPLEDEEGRNDGVENGNPTYGVSGTDGTAVDLDGSGDWFDLKSADYDLGDFSLTIWVYPRDTGTAINQITEFSNELRMEINVTNSGDMEFRLVFEDGNVETILTGGGYLPEGTWTHLIFSYDGSTMRLFKNGSVTHSISYSGSADVRGGFALGRDYEQFTQYWDGRFDDMRLYKTGLNEEEGESLYNSY